ncbi:Retrovirus-related Pol polyprotein from transposon 17.6, partial [Mucuna pruriens]
MRSPQNVKEVQQLMGKVVALSRFISRVSDIATPVLNTLKKGRNFAWTLEYEEAFLRLKAMLGTPPILVRPELGRPLHLYISVTETAISSALVQEREKEQCPVYFISKTLQEPERRYQKIEKGALALVIASRRLRPYFQSFSIIVRTDMPIQQVLRKPDLAGRMVAWSVQLSEFDISFEKRGTNKSSGAGGLYHETHYRAGTSRRRVVFVCRWVIQSDREWRQSDFRRTERNTRGAKSAFRLQSKQ